MVENQALGQIGDDLAQKLLNNFNQPEIGHLGAVHSAKDHSEEIIPLTDSQGNVIYDPDQFPYNISQAKDHAKAKRVCKKKDDVKTPEELLNEICPCCQLTINNEKLPICCTRNDFDDLGPGIPLYFETLLYCIIMLVIILVIQGIYSLISNYVTDDCVPESSDNEVVCHRDFINRISISNKFKHHDLYIIQGWVNLASMLAVIASLHYYRVYQTRSAEEIDRDNISPADYTIMINGLPKKDCNERLVEQTVNEYWNRINFEENPNIITKIVLAYNIVDYVECCREKKKLFMWKRKADHHREHHGKEDKGYNEEEFKHKLNFIEEKLKKQEEEVQSGRTCGIAFVSFRTQKIRREFMEFVDLSMWDKLMDFMKERLLFCFNFKLKRFHLFGRKDCRLKVCKAAEPDEIIWENLGYSDRYRSWARFKTVFLTFILLLFCFGLIFGISYLQENLKNKFAGEKKMEKALQVLSMVASFLVVFINTCLVLQIRKFADMEKNLTTTELYISVARKLTYAQFSNTALIVLLANLSILKYWKLFSQGGLASDLFMIFLSNAYIPPLMAIFDPFYFLKLFQRWNMERLRKNGHSVVTQAEANEMYEGSSIDMSAKYAALTKTMWLTSFYVCITPIGLLISIFNLIIVYWVDKILLLRRNARPKVVSEYLSKEILELIEYCPFFMAAGSLVFHHILFDPSLTDQMPDLIAICLGCFNFIFPTANVLSCCKNDSQGVIGEDKDYFQAQEEDFCGANYDLSNPVTRESALRTLNMSRLHKTSKKSDGETDIPTQKDQIQSSAIRRNSSLAHYALQGDIPNYQYKKKMSRKPTTHANYPDLEGNIQLVQTQILAPNNQFYNPQTNYGYDQNTYQNNQGMNPSYNYPQYPPEQIPQERL